jgi:alpha-tubulin suppressor-like RCC1 family protein
VSGGHVDCWGYGFGGASAGLHRIEGLDYANELRVGLSHACAVSAFGPMMCWGSNFYGQLGDGTLEDRIAPIAPVGVYTGIFATGDDGTCEVEGYPQVVRCWGRNERHALAVAGPADGGIEADAASMDATSAEDVAADGNGTIDDSGLGPVPTDGSLSDVTYVRTCESSRCQPTPAAIPMFPASISWMAGGGNRYCVSGTNNEDYSGGVWCWGLPPLGDGSTAIQTVPTRIGNLNDVRDASSLSLGSTHACVLRPSGQVACWGSNRDGELGDGTTINTRTPKGVSVLSHGLALAGGETNNCAVSASGTLLCWGEAHFNNYVFGGGDYYPISAQNPRFTGVRSIAISRYFGCALTSTAGVVACWGYGSQGAAGVDDPDRDYLLEPYATGSVAVTGAVQITVGDQHSCARNSGGRVFCWGSNTNGQLGSGGADFMSHPTATAVSTRLVDIVEIAAGTGGYHTCARSSRGEVECWGSNSYGQVTMPGGTDGLSPVAVVGVSDAVGLALGSQHSCALRANGRVVCWGANDQGQLGFAVVPSGRPGGGVSVDAGATDLTDVTGLTDAVEISAGENHTCARRRSGSVVCWGANEYGQLGDGTTEPRSVPVVAVSLDGVNDISTGFQFTCARRNSGEIWCWGRNDAGQLGDDTEDDRLVPTPTARVP